MTQTKYLLAMILVAFISGCSKTDSGGNTMVALNPTIVSVTTIAPTITFTAVLTPTPLPTVTNTATTIPTVTPTPTSTASPTPTVTPSSTPSLWQMFPTSEPANPAGVNLELVNQVGGAIRVVEVVDNYAYLGIGPRLVVVDVSNPSAPYQVGQSDILPGLIQSIKVANNMAFVLVNTDIVWLINVTEPNNPQVIEVLSIGTPVERIETEGHILYVGRYLDSQWDVTLFDIANPETPLLLISYFLSGWWLPRDGVLYVFFPDEINLMAIWDMQDPLNPQISYIANTVEAEPYFWDISGTYFYYYGEIPEPGIRVVDVSDPANPVMVIRDQEFRLGLEELLVQGQEGVLFLIDDFCDAGSCGAAVEILDVSDLKYLRKVETVRVGHLAYGAVVANGLLYVTTGENLSIVAPDTRGVIGSFQATGNITHVGVAEQTLYALDSFDTTLYAYSLTNPVQPFLLGPYDIKAWYIQDFFLTPDFGYVATGAGQAPGTIEILHIQQPTVITAVGQFTTTEYVGSMENIVVTDNYAFALLDDNLAVLDATHPTELQLLTQFDWGFDSFLWHEDVLYGATGPYVAEEFIGVRIFDVHDPQNPEEIAYLHGVSRVLAVVDGYAYAATEEGISVLDVSILPEVRVVYTIPQNHLVQDAILLDHYLVVATDHLLVYDLSVPEQPVLLSSFPLFAPYDYSTIGLLAVWENFVYVADAAAGILVFRINH